TSWYLVNGYPRAAALTCDTSCRCICDSTFMPDTTQVITSTTTTTTSTTTSTSTSTTVSGSTTTSTSTSTSSTST
ncbi:unnamed protein product, partial [Adineta steineri]